MEEYIDERVIKEAIRINTLKKAYDTAVKVGDSNFAKTLEYILLENGIKVNSLAK